MVKNSCLVEINNKYPEFSSKERVVADYILKNPGKVVFLTIDDFAKDLKVSDSTVFRFIKKLGYEGYQFFKVALASEITKTPQTDSKNVKNYNSTDPTYEKVFKSYIKVLENSLHGLNPDSFNDSIKAIVSANKIGFFGMGGSNPVAMDAYYKLLRAGMPCMFYSDYHMQLIHASQLGKDDTAIIFSQSGMNKDVINITEILKENKVTIIGFCDNPHSPFAKMVDISMFSCSNERDYPYEGLGSRIAQLTMLDAIYLEIIGIKKKQSSDSMSKARRAISSRKY